MAARNGTLGDPLSTRNETPTNPDAQRSTELGRYQQVDDVDNDPPSVRDVGVRLSSNQPRYDHGEPEDQHHGEHPPASDNHAESKRNDERRKDAQKDAHAAKIMIAQPDSNQVAATVDRGGCQVRHPARPESRTRLR